MKKLVEFFRRLYFRTFITHNDNHDYKNFIFLSSDERENSISNKTFFDQKYIIKTISQFLPSNYVLKIYQHDYKLINSKSIIFKIFLTLSSQCSGTSKIKILLLKFI